jgi:hypothetical protein
MFVDIFKKIGKILGFQYLIELITSKIFLPSAFVLILVNLIPIFGMILFKWNPYDIIILYWLENIVIGIYNLVRILTAKGIVPKSEGKLSPFFSNIFISLFFSFHYGIFTFVQGIFIYQLIMDKSTFVINHNYTGLIAFFVALMISHGYSLFRNYFRQKEYLENNPLYYLMKPYGRIFVMQFTIILGFMLSTVLPQGFIIIFILAKILIDLKFHIDSHLVWQNKTPTISSES